jgi:hypothetical protein
MSAMVLDMCPKSAVYLFPAATAHDYQLFLSFMSDKLRSRQFSVAIDEEAKLDQNSEPDVVRTYDKCTVVIVGIYNGLGEAVGRRDDVGGFLRKCGLKYFVSGIMIVVGMRREVCQRSNSR